MCYSCQSLVKCWRIGLRQIWNSSWLQEKPLGQGCCLRVPQKPFFELIVVDFFALKKIKFYNAPTNNFSKFILPRRKEPQSFHSVFLLNWQSTWAFHLDRCGFRFRWNTAQRELEWYMFKGSGAQISITYIWSFHPLVLLSGEPIRRASWKKWCPWRCLHTRDRCAETLN